MATQLIAPDENTSQVDIKSEVDSSIELKEAGNKRQSDPTSSTSYQTKDVIESSETKISKTEKLNCDESDDEETKKVSKIKIKTRRDKDGKIKGEIQRTKNSFLKGKRKIVSEETSSDDDEPLLLRRKIEKRGWEESISSDQHRKKRQPKIKKCQLVLHRLKVPDRVTHGALVKKNNSRNSQNKYIIKTWLRNVVKIKLVKEADADAKASQNKDDDKKTNERKTVSNKLKDLKQLHDSFNTSDDRLEKTSKEKPLKIKKEKGKT